MAVHPTQNRDYSSRARGNHVRSGPTGLGLARRYASVPWVVNLSATIHATTPEATR